MLSVIYLAPSRDPISYPALRRHILLHSQPPPLLGSNLLPWPLDRPRFLLMILRLIAASFSPLLQSTNESLWVAPRTSANFFAKTSPGAATRDLCSSGFMPLLFVFTPGAGACS